MSDREMLTLVEASSRLGLQVSTLRKWILERRIGYCKLGRSVRLPVDVVEKMIRESYREARVEGNRR